MSDPVIILDHTSDDVPSIPEFYRGAKIFITGGSGFMGKVLVEKLLRSCPGLDTIYLLLRPKKGKEPSSRVKDITDVPLFDRLRKEYPSFLSKISVISGDVKELSLGLSEDDRHLLQEEVSVIFHCAASVRFDDSIKDAILTNVRGTLEMINLAKEMKNLKVFLHLSTTYCNFDQVEVVEEIYPPHGDWRAMIRLVEETTDNQLLNCLTPKIIGKLPNTYTYAKSLSEHVIKDHQDLLPIVIIRPSIVLASWKEPMGGWIDNFNGPVGLWAGYWKGLIRVALTDRNTTSDYVPVDTAICSMIVIAWHRALSNPQTLPVYNCSSMVESHTIDFGDVTCKPFLRKYPMNDIVWAPHCHTTTSKSSFFIRTLLQHMLPALLIDFLLKLSGKKMFLVKLQRKIYCAMLAVAIFVLRDINFSNVRYLNVALSLKEADKESFDYSVVCLFRSSTLTSYFMGVRLYLFQEQEHELDAARVHFRRMYWVDKVCKTLLFLAFLWAVDACAMVTSTLHHVVLVPQYWDQLMQSLDVDDQIMTMPSTYCSN